LEDIIVSPIADSYVRNTAVIVSSYVAQHDVETTALSNVIRDVFDTLKSLTEDAGSPINDYARTEPDRAHSDSIFPDYLVCLEDGEQHKMLKRHLWTRYRMTPEAYREKWGLPDDYPMVAPNYAKLRSKLAKRASPGR
jgi:predicted transcriptional regulator